MQDDEVGQEFSFGLVPCVVLRVICMIWKGGNTALCGERLSKVKSAR